LVTYWTTSASKTVNSQTGTLGREALIDGVVWKQYRHTLNNPSSVTISGTGIIDELRMYPSDAEVITYTYAEDKGISTQCDAYDRVTYYEYDDFTRVAVIRDLDYRIQKSFCYGQAGETHNCNTPIYYNEMKQSTVTRMDCMSGLEPGSVTYIIPEKTYYSYLSIDDANQKADIDLVDYENYYGSINGTCNNLFYSFNYSGFYNSTLCIPPQNPI
jgi:hypothetical protein